MRVRIAIVHQLSPVAEENPSVLLPHLAHERDDVSSETVIRNCRRRRAFLPPDKREELMRATVLALAGVLIATSFAFAQGEHQGTPQEQQACTRDAQRFCRKLLGDDNAVQQCLQQHRARLSASCRKVFQSRGM